MLTRTHLLTLLSLTACVVGCDSADDPPTGKPASSQDDPGSSSHFVFARIQDSVKPIERGETYEDPLDEALQKAGLGEVTGGGSSLEKDGSIAWVGVDIELTDLDRGIPFVRRKLRDLGAPHGSVLEYSRDDQSVETAVHE